MTVTLRNQGEVARLDHAISRLRTHLDAIQRTIHATHTPIVADDAQTLLQAACEVAMQIAKIAAQEQFEKNKCP